MCSTPRRVRPRGFSCSRRATRTRTSRRSAPSRGSPSASARRAVAHGIASRPTRASGRTSSRRPTRRSRRSIAATSTRCATSSASCSSISSPRRASAASTRRGRCARRTSGSRRTSRGSSHGRRAKARSSSRTATTSCARYGRRRVAKFKRPDGRAADALRPVTIEVGVSKFAEGSARIAFGDTIVLCLATLTDSVPRFLEGSGRGWITAEYAMLPRSTPERSQRESIAGRPGGRTFEIQRLIGRALRTTIDLKALGPRSVTVDCEVIQADGGTRTAAVTGGYVALAHALRRITPSPLINQVAPVAAGLVPGELILHLAYAEDSIADADVNLVATDKGKLVEVQGTAEKEPFSREDFDRVLALGMRGIEQLMDAQRRALR